MQRPTLAFATVELRTAEEVTLPAAEIVKPIVTTPFKPEFRASLLV